MTPLGLLAVGGLALTLASAWRHRPTRGRARLQLGASVLSWAVLWFATGSSFARLGMMNLPDHMIGHVLVMFLVPMGLRVGATTRSWWWLLPTARRRAVLRWWYVDRRVHVPKWLASPIAAAVAMNAVMVSAHVPALFDYAMEHDYAMNWVMEPAFLLSGCYFFHFLLPSWPHRVTVKIRLQLAMVLFSMLEMLIMAMSMSIFTKTSWYSVFEMSSMPSMPYMPGMGISPIVAFHQQQLAAAILWICGDFWAVPCLVLIVRRIIVRDGSLLAALDRQSSKLSVESPVV